MHRERLNAKKFDTITKDLTPFGPRLGMQISAEPGPRSGWSLSGPFPWSAVSYSPIMMWTSRACSSPRFLIDIGETIIHRYNPAAIKAAMDKVFRGGETNIIV